MSIKKFIPFTDDQIAIISKFLMHLFSNSVEKKFKVSSVTICFNRLIFAPVDANNRATIDGFFVLLIH